MAYDYEADLNKLKEQQKASAIADLQKERDASLSDLKAEESTIKPTYYKKKDTANVQNQIASKNFHEYLANSGRSNSGIGAQYEMSRQNTLQRNLNDLNREEAGALADVARRRTDINNAYNTGLTSANAQIEANYITNLLNERQKAWEREQAEKEFNESVRQFNASLSASRSGGGSSRSGSSSSNKITTAYYSGTINPDAKYGTFSNGYQPNNINGDKLTGTGKYIMKDGITLQGTKTQTKQQIWQTSDGTQYYWDGNSNRYKVYNG